MKVSDFDFELPAERIALHPAEPRDSARLLVVRPGEPLVDARVTDLLTWLQPGDVLVVNDPDRFTQNYERYLLNKFREILPYDEVPIRIILRSKSRVEKRAAGTTGSGKDILHIPDQMTGEFDSDLPVEMIDTEALLADLPDDARAYFDD